MTCVRNNAYHQGSGFASRWSQTIALWILLDQQLRGTLGDRAASADRQPIRSTPVATDATTTKGSGGGAPRDTLRSASASCTAASR